MESYLNKKETLDHLMQRGFSEVRTGVPPNWMHFQRFSEWPLTFGPKIIFGVIPKVHPIRGFNHNKNVSAYTLLG